MMIKITASLMLALLMLPSCCCLKQDKAEEKDCASKCCASAENSLPSPVVPLQDGSDPCGCEEMMVQVLGLPEDAVLISNNGKEEVPKASIEVQDSSYEWQADVYPSHSLMRLSAFHPPGSRLLQDYCVYRI